MTKGRMIDLSKKVTPGKAEGPLDTGARKYEIKSFAFPPGEIMHMIEMESHISTHIEAPCHYVPARYGKPAHDISEVELTRFFGMAVLVDCKALPPRSPIGAKILEKSSIRQGDIVLLGRGPHSGQDRCYLAKDGIEHLLEKKIKMVGVDDTVFPEDPKYALRDLQNISATTSCSPTRSRLSRGSPTWESLKRIDLFFGFPAKMGGLDSFPIRAVAIEIP